MYNYSFVPFVLGRNYFISYFCNLHTNHINNQYTSFFFLFVILRSSEPLFNLFGRIALRTFEILNHLYIDLLVTYSFSTH